MKIERLYTLSQFILLIKKMLKKGDIEVWTALEKIFNYLAFLLQPLKEEMFVNDIREPKPKDKKYNNLGKSYGEIFTKDFEAWQEAERKVIFNYNERDTLREIKEFDFGNYRIAIALDGFHLRIQQTGNWIKLDSLYEIAEKTNGEIKLKNVEI